jgi:2-methylfumaryl-CoA isomerase
MTMAKAQAAGAGGFARDFATSDGETVMVSALTQEQFADLVRTARLDRTFAFLERVLHADFSASDDLYAHRNTIATLLAPWFSRRSVADLAAAFAGTAVSWARLHNR